MFTIFEVSKAVLLDEFYVRFWICRIGVAIDRDVVVASSVELPGAIDKRIGPMELHIYLMRQIPH